MQETGVCFYSSEDYAYFSSSEQKYINRMLRLAKENPKKVIILKTPEENCGMIYCQVPQSWVSIKVPTKREYTEEQKLQAREAALLLNSTVNNRRNGSSNQSL